MKYIRTNGGIIPDKDKYLQDLDIEQYSMYMQGLLKQADTIEELCDYELHFNSDNELVIRKCEYANFDILKSHLKMGYIKDVKLAVLTDKGLIYVAKMNEKGELELL